MSREEVKKEIEYLRDKRSKYGWRDGDSERFNELQKLWGNFVRRRPVALSSLWRFKTKLNK